MKDREQGPVDAFQADGTDARSGNLERSGPDRYSTQRERIQRRRLDQEQNETWQRMNHARGTKPEDRQEARRLKKEERRRKREEIAKRREDEIRGMDGEPPNFWLRVRIIFFMILVLSALIVCWTAAFYLTHGLRWHISPLVRQLLNSVLGFVIFGVSISIISRFAKRRQSEFYQLVIDALKRISKGDFKVEIPVFGENGHWGGIVKGINNMAADLNNLEHMRQEFISNVSHEIQSPLTSISGFARVLREENLSPGQRDHYLNIIEEESVRLSRLSENMLRLASLDSDKHPFHAEPVRLDKQLQMLVLACEPQWQGKDLDMSVEFEPVTIEADRDLLSQVWVNLLHNAIKFTPEGGTVQVFLEESGPEAVVRVRDSGIGISAEDLEHIFERFFKADKSRTRSGGGSGLGLSIIQKIVQMHGGSVSVQSAQGEGTEMTVRLPKTADRAAGP
ncbi:HAMP domain-containing sensor histidine kinase [Paenibacillus sp. Y412MC10]|uniref:sensor histidine kinase n=1 Tax=Geobacillus sp. (strain Y412MC10) TaxID=481743 RepID=UPI0028CB8610|nr:HAMP domain-containing sensor histidine kinase [Paenibacillus sp. Y412MC10]